ncbi:serine-rich adhesin for platelets-like isoform X2 [Dreissena polymorpha]|nr:serine-rich adhesin for platelets-like isoform X2 [Dreissena polymorpha]
MSCLMRRPGLSENNFCRNGGDDDYDGPVDMTMASDDLYRSPTQTYPGCFGLPYQDHNYGAPPPPTPPTPPLVAMPIKPAEGGVEVKEEVVLTSDTPTLTRLSTETLSEDQDEADDPTRCICDFVHDDGYMIQCDKCSVWQHIVCMGLDRDSIPDVYLCEVCNPRAVDRARAREFQIRKREFLKTLIVKTHDSSTDTDPEEVNNRLKAYGLDHGANSHKAKMKLKKRKERTKSLPIKRIKSKELKTEKEKENASNEANRKSKLLIKDFSSKTAQARKEKLCKKIERMRAERLSKEMLDDKLSSDDLRDDEKIINTITSTPVTHDESAQDLWDISTFNEWEQSYETARYNQYTTYVQEYLNSTCVNGHHNDIADLVTDGLRVQRCFVKHLKNRRKGLEASCNIPNGQPIIEVIGKVMTKQQYDKDNFGQRQLSPFVFFYGTVFDLDLVIDASDYGNDARFIRRSCQPNAAVHHVVAGGQAHFITVATKEIPERTEITIPFDYDYKKWNFCFECACLRNNCPVTRYQKRRLRFQKMQQQNISSPLKKYHKPDKVPKLIIRTPGKSPTKSPVKPTVKSPEKALPEVISPSIDPIHLSPTSSVASPAKMLRRSQVSKSVDSRISHGSNARIRSLRVPSQNSNNTNSCAVPNSITAPEPTSMLRSSDTDPLTSPECKDSSAKQESSEMPKEEKRKLTREERKMEAIMKAFEKMEKRNTRKASVDPQKFTESIDTKYSKINETQKEKSKEWKEVKKGIKKEKVESGSDSDSLTKDRREIKQEEEVDKHASVKVEDTSPEKKVKIETTDHGEALNKPVLRDRTQSKGKKTKKGGRRRTRNMSGAGSSDVQMESQEENSNSGLPLAAAISCPPTPAIAVDFASDVPPAFRFLKTKRHLMNEWLSEKSIEGRAAVSRAEPLEVAVDDSMFVTCLPSPRNSMDRLRRNSQSSGVRERSVSLNQETSAGSAKKRWLRQAMGEGTESTSGSPLPGSGCQSPNPHAMPSPGGSPPIDFVTPLKKRRLARESMTVECGYGDLSAPTPSVGPAQTSSYFAGLSESFENIKNSNGLHMVFSPLTTVEDVAGVTEGFKAESTNVSEVPVASDHTDMEISPRFRAPQYDGSVVSSNECDRIGNGTDSEINTFRGTTDESISNMDNNVSSECAVYEAMGSWNVAEQTENCDQNFIKSASRSSRSEPDSSDCALVDKEERVSAAELECDSGSQEVHASAQAGQRGNEVDSAVVNCEPVSEQVDSTECGEEAMDTNAVSSPVTLSENNQCDSCNSETTDSVLISKDLSPHGPSSVFSDKVCTSSNISSSPSFVDSVSNEESSTVQIVSHVDSSTDKGNFVSASNALDVSGSNIADDSANTYNTSPRVSLSLDFNSVLSDNEVSNSHCEERRLSITSHSLSSRNVSDPFVVSSYGNIDINPGPNRHLKFLNENSYSADMTVDSTTQYVSHMSAASVNYDSDSMDVTSATEPGYQLCGDDSRRTSDDSLSSCPESSFCAESQLPKEKKKVSIQEYLQRKKEKTSTSSSSPSASQDPSVSMTTSNRSASVSSTSSTSPLKLSTPISREKLDRKLPPLPSLPSLPMFEKTDRKEFKSSSDLLSPIFNRKDKQEEARKHVSLAERLRSEFGLDDSADIEADIDSNIDTSVKAAGILDGDAPPPPPPPPPNSSLRTGAGIQSAGRQLRFQNGPTSHAMAFATQGNRSTADLLMSNLGSASAPQMVPPPSPAVKPLNNLGASKSPIQGSLSTLLSSVKTPQQIQNDLSVQLAAIKAQLNKVQQQASLPSATNMSAAPMDQLPTNPVNGMASSMGMASQVFEYGHQSNTNFQRQNSYLGGSSGLAASTAPNGNSYQGNGKSPSLGGTWIAQGPGGHGFAEAAALPQNGSGNYSTLQDKSPVWNHRRSSAGGKHPASDRKPFGKQISHKY